MTKTESELNILRSGNMSNFAAFSSLSHHVELFPRMGNYSHKGGKE